MYMSIVGIIDAIVSSTLTADTSDPCNQHHHAQHGHIEYTKRFDDENNLQHQQHTTIQQDSHHHQHQQQWSRKHTLIPVRIVCVAEKCPTISATMSGFMNCTIMTIIIGGMVVRIIFLVPLLLLFPPTPHIHQQHEPQLHPRCAYVMVFFLCHFLVTANTIR